MKSIALSVLVTMLSVSGCARSGDTMIGNTGDASVVVSPNTSAAVNSPGGASTAGDDSDDRAESRPANE